MLLLGLQLIRYGAWGHHWLFGLFWLAVTVIENVNMNTKQTRVNTGGEVYRWKKKKKSFWLNYWLTFSIHSLRPIKTPICTNSSRRAHIFHISIEWMPHGFVSASYMYMVFLCRHHWQVASLISPLTVNVSVEWAEEKCHFAKHFETIHANEYFISKLNISKLFRLLF